MPKLLSKTRRKLPIRLHKAKCTHANCLEEQVYILNLTRSMKQWLRNHSYIALVTDEGKSYIFPNHCFMTPTVKLKLCTTRYKHFWFFFYLLVIVLTIIPILCIQGEVLVIFLPLSILTATVLQVAVLSIPNASASMTWPKAPRPRGLP